jgi:hypothetical protein
MSADFASLGTSKSYDEDSGDLISTNTNCFKCTLYLNCSPHQQAARLSLVLNNVPVIAPCVF